MILMTQVNMHEAKTHLSSLVERALAGEEIIIARAGKPAISMVPVTTRQKSGRQFGCMKGEFTIADDAFDPMTEEELALWYGE